MLRVVDGSPQLLLLLVPDGTQRGSDPMTSATVMLQLVGSDGRAVRQLVMAVVHQVDAAQRPGAARRRRRVDCTAADDAGRHVGVRHVTLTGRVVTAVFVVVAVFNLWK